jgi:hypothetical protein
MLMRILAIVRIEVPLAIWSGIWRPPQVSFRHRPTNSEMPVLYLGVPERLPDSRRSEFLPTRGLAPGQQF